ncbi:hypothetical protein EBU94_04885 [bacterium]|jgi:hypothetical protein|nr:hypothetical protein [bacterium]
MIDKANVLDELGYYKEADIIDRFIIAQNNYVQKTKKVHPLHQINTKLDTLNSKIIDMRDMIDEIDFDSSEPQTENNQVIINQESPQNSTKEV